MVACNPGGEKHAPRISRGHFFLTIFFRVTHDGLSERGTTQVVYYIGAGREEQFRNWTNGCANWETFVADTKCF